MKTHFEPLMNKKIKKFEADAINQNVRSISKNKICKALNPMKIGEAVGPDCIPAGTSKCLGNMAVKFLLKLLYRILCDKNMSKEW